MDEIENEDEAAQDGGSYLSVKIPGHYRDLMDRYKLPGETYAGFIRRSVDFFCGATQQRLNPGMDLSQPQMSLEDVSSIIKILTGKPSSKSPR